MTKTMTMILCFGLLGGAFGEQFMRKESHGGAGDAMHIGAGGSPQAEGQNIMAEGRILEADSDDSVSAISSSSEKSNKGEKAKGVEDCLRGKTVVIRSRPGNLQDNKGAVKFSTNRGSSETWILHDAGDNKFFLRSHRNKNLKDDRGRLKLVGEARSWEKWGIHDAGNGKVFLRSHRNQNLQDNDGNVGLSPNTGDKEKWSIFDTNGKPLCQPVFYHMEFGGSRHETEDETKKEYRAPEMDLVRPEQAKSEQCKGSVCSDCGHRDQCFHGVGADELKATMEANSMYTELAAKVWARCETSGEWMVKVTSISNGVISIYIDGVLQKEVTSATTGGHVRIPSAGHKSSHVRVALRPTDPSMACAAHIELKLNYVNISTDQCMGIKDCLSVFGDDSEASFQIRNRHDLQLRCLEKKAIPQLLAIPDSTRIPIPGNGACDHARSGITPSCEVCNQYSDGRTGGWSNQPCQFVPAKDRCYPAKYVVAKGWTAKTQCTVPVPTSPATAPSFEDKCDEWLVCLPDTTQIKLKTFLRAVGTPISSMLMEESSTQQVTPCIDPSVEDPESWDCDCLQEMIDSCGGLSEDCLKNRMCKIDQVCQAWKQQHCSSEMIAMHKNTSTNVGQQRSALISHRTKSQANVGDSLDSSLQGKCSQ